VAQRVGKAQSLDPGARSRSASNLTRRLTGQTFPVRPAVRRKPCSQSRFDSDVTPSRGFALTPGHFHQLALKIDVLPFQTFRARRSATRTSPQSPSRAVFQLQQPPGVAQILQGSRFRVQAPFHLTFWTWAHWILCAPAAPPGKFEQEASGAARRCFA